MEHPSWVVGIGLEACGLYYEGYVEDVDAVLEKHRSATVTTYGIRRSSSRKAEKKEDETDKENRNPDSNEQKSSKRAASVQKLFWSKTEGMRIISFDGAPFTVDESKLYDCQHGERYWKQKETKGSHFHLHSTRKVGCHAHIQMRCYTVYPEYAVPLTENTGVSKRQFRLLRERHLEELRQAMDSGIAKSVKKYFISLPTEQAHNGHPTGARAGYSQRIHPKLVNKITEYVSCGISDTNEIKRMLRHYVQHELPKESQIIPTATDRAYWPVDQDIRNHVSMAKRALELSKIDQENLRLKIQEWKKSSPESCHFFRPYMNLPKDGELVEATDDLHTKPGCFNGNSGGDDDEVGLVGSSGQCTQTFLWVHQEKWQKELLQRYGNRMCLIDATYKTTKYDLALFFICVKTNVGYSIVAEFILQSESADEIAQALRILRQWNPHWEPAYFMCDYSEAELLALQMVFPQTKVYLCDFHREQAWERWVKDHKHGLNKLEQGTLLDLLRECANAPAPMPDDAHQVDYNYKLALTSLQSSDVWQNHPKVQQWLTTKWLHIPERWARAYRDYSYHVAVNTNNGVEAQNKTLKYSYLPKRKDITVSFIVNLLVTEFLPESYQKYLFKNHQLCPEYNGLTYNPEVPEHLHGYTREAILHCMTRERKARHAYSIADVEIADETNGKFFIHKKSGGKHAVMFGKESGKPSCTCKDWHKFHFPCKHFYAVFKFFPNWTWSSLPQGYREDPYMRPDVNALSDYHAALDDSPIDTDHVQQPDDSEVVSPPHEPENANPLQSEEEQVTICDMFTTKATNVKTLQMKLRITARLIESLSYNITDPKLLQTFTMKTNTLATEMQDSLPAEAGLILRPKSVESKVARKIKLKYKLANARRYLNLGTGKRSGRLKCTYAHRVGSKAAKLRKAAEESTLKETSTLHTAEESNQSTKDPTNGVPTCTETPGIRAGNKRARHCGECSGCQSDDCGHCRFCKDMKKFGGPGRKKKRCINRACSGQKPQPPIGASVNTTAKGLTGSGNSGNSLVIRFLEEHGRRIEQMKGDGNCMFRALSHHLFDDQEEHYRVRTMIIRFENFNRHLFENLLMEINEKDYSEHTRIMSRHTVWGTHIELLAAATYFQRPVYFYKVCTSSNRWEVFRPLAPSTDVKYPIEVEPFPDNTTVPHHFELLLYDKEHYNCIVSSESGKVCITPPAIIPVHSTFDTIL